jgi:hypothetical protein
MAQHFLLSAKARTLSLAKVFRMGEDAAYGLFCEMRWPDTDGEPVCPRCGCCELRRRSSSASASPPSPIMLTVLFEL